MPPHSVIKKIIIIISACYLKRNVVVLGVDPSNLGQLFWVFTLEEMYAKAIVE